MKMKGELVSKSHSSMMFSLRHGQHHDDEKLTASGLDLEVDVALIAYDI